MIPTVDDHWLKTLAAPHGSSSKGVLGRVALFGGVAVLVWLASRMSLRVTTPVGVHEVAGAVIALILAFRTNTAYARFWEGRILWGAIVNASRNLSRLVEAHAAPPADEARAVSSWIVAFAHATRTGLRGQEAGAEIRTLVPEADFAELRLAPHAALFCAGRLSRSVRALAEQGRLDPMMRARAEGLVADLVDYLGACERIRKTPTPAGYVLLARRAIVILLATLPAALVESAGAYAILTTVLVAYPVLLIEALANELDNPFGHDGNDLPLSRICQTIEADLLGAAQEIPRGRPFIDD